MEAVTATRNELRREIQDLRGELSRRIDVLALAVRQNSDDIRQNSEDIRELKAGVQQLKADLRQKLKQFAKAPRKFGACENYSSEKRITKLCSDCKPASRL